ncbi:MAG: CIA30 family protein [Acidobacteriota bacterium]
MSRPVSRRALALGAVLFLAVATVFFLLPTPDSGAGAGLKSTAEGAAVPQGFAITDARLFDGERFLESSDVRVADGVIQEVGVDLDLPEGLRTVDGRGKTLLPGLIDAHVHTWGTSRADAARFGVTTLLDQFSSPSLLKPARADRRGGGSRTEADLFSAGMLATAAGGHGTQYGVPVDTLSAPGEAAEWVRARKAEGSDWVKIVMEAGSESYPIATLDGETVEAVIAAAHAEGLMAVVHVSNLDDALEAARYGADGLVHVWRDRVPNSAEVQLLRESGIFVVPTLVVIEGMADPGPSMDLAERLEAGLSAQQKSSLEQRFPEGLPGRERLGVAMRSVGLLHAAGVPILAGSDAPNPTTAMGLSLHREIELLKAAGLKPREAYAAATSVPAEHFGLGARGRIAAGQVADLVLVEGDPRKRDHGTAWQAEVLKAGKKIEFAAPRGGSPVAENEVASEAPRETLISDFEGASGLEQASRFGAGWQGTTDQRMGGDSIASLKIEGGALVVTGKVGGAAMYPWSGAMVFLGPTAMAPVDLSGRSELVFRVRGEPRRLNVMLFAGDMQGIPPMQSVRIGEEWQTVTLELEKFAGGDSENLRAFSWNAGAPAGPFRFEIDDVELR